MKKILTYFLTFVIIQMLAGSIIIGLLNAASTAGYIPAVSQATMLIAGTTVANLIILICFLAFGWLPSQKTFLINSPLKISLLSILLTIGLLIPTQCLESLIPESMRQDIMSEHFLSIMSTAWGYLAIGIFAPIAEEVVFRGAIQHALFGYYTTRTNQRRAAWIAIITSAVLFAVVHGNPAQMPHAVIMGIILGWLCYHTGSIIPGIIVHWVNNSIAFGLCYIWPETYDMTPIELFHGDTLQLAAVFSISSLIAVLSLLAINRIRMPEA